MEAFGTTCLGDLPTSSRVKMQVIASVLDTTRQAVESTEVRARAKLRATPAARILGEALDLPSGLPAASPIVRRARARRASRR